MKNVKHLEDIVELIKATILLSETNKTSSPYFFICGAGISCPEIPTASRIIELCKEQVALRYKKKPTYFEKFVEESERLRMFSMKYYSYWIEKAYPNRADRSGFFKKLISGSKISTAVLLLAQILNSEKITRTVFTTNFDENLERALNLIGTDEVFTADNPRDNLALELDNRSIQIAHVHGSYRFYDCANLDTEIVQITQGEEVANVSQSLSFFLQSKAPIIVGYSGWEDDAIMQCLKNRLSAPTPYNYLWVCYSNDDYELLPEWLKNNNCVIFAVPESSSDDCSQIEKEILLSEQQKKPQQIAATTFFGRLISEFEITPPILFTNPYIYFSNLVQKLLPDNEDVFHLRRWADRMQIWGASESEGDKLITLLETASAKKDYSAINDLLDTKMEKDFWRLAECAYVYKSIIVPLVRNEEVVSDLNILLKFHSSILKFSQMYRTILIQGDLYAAVMDSIIDINYYSSRNTFREEILQFFKKVLDIVRDDDMVNVVYIKTCRLLASLTTKEEESEYIKQILEKTNNDSSDNKTIIYNRALALVNMIKNLKTFDEKLAYFNESKDLSEKLKSNWLIMRMLVEQARIGLHAKKACERNKMITEALEKALKFNYKAYCNQILDIVECYQECLDRSRRKMQTEMKEKLFGLVNELYGFSFEYCQSRLRYTRLANDVIDPKTNEELFVKIGKWVITFQEKMPHDCPSFYQEEARFLLFLIKSRLNIITEQERGELFTRLLEIASKNDNVNELMKGAFSQKEIESARLTSDDLNQLSQE